MCNIEDNTCNCKLHMSHVNIIAAEAADALNAMKQSLQPLQRAGSHPQNMQLLLTPLLICKYCACHGLLQVTAFVRSKQTAAMLLQLSTALRRSKICLSHHDVHIMTLFILSCQLQYYHGFFCRWMSLHRRAHSHSWHSAHCVCPPLQHSGPSSPAQLALSKYTAGHYKHEA